MASVFVSRIDTAADKLLDQLQDKKAAASLKGKAAVANSNVIYQEYAEIFSANEFKGMEKQGASVQRVLWGSTGTKNPAYSDIKYMAENKNSVSRTIIQILSLLSNSSLLF